MSRSTLTPVSYLVLGWLADGPATPYDLKRKVAHSVGYSGASPFAALCGAGATRRAGAPRGGAKSNGAPPSRLLDNRDGAPRFSRIGFKNPARRCPRFAISVYSNCFFGEALSSESVVALPELRSRRTRETVHLRRAGAEIPEMATFGRAALQAALPSSAPSSSSGVRSPAPTHAPGNERSS